MTRRSSRANNKKPSRDLFNECLCEKCIGLSPSHPWRLQNAVTFQLHEWLDKRLTRSKFNVDLDPELRNMDDGAQEYNKQLTTYAVNDCLAIQHLLIQHELIKPSKNTTTTTALTQPALVQISSDDEEPYASPPPLKKTNSTIQTEQKQE